MPKDPPKTTTENATGAVANVPNRTPKPLRFDLARIISAFAKHIGPPGSLHAPNLAAVSVILRQRPKDMTKDVTDGQQAEAEVLLIERAQHEKDPWSGQMAFPGGHAEASDRDLLETATRETYEEVGLNLSTKATLLGHLDDIPAISRGKPVGLSIRPFVFSLSESELSLTPNAEVAAVVWGPLGLMARGELDTSHPYHSPSGVLIMPAYQLDQRTVWGLTYRMLVSLIELVRNA